jgi:hypothetical protein
MDYCCIAGLRLYWRHRPFAEHRDRIFAEDTLAAQSDRPDRRHRYFLQALTLASPQNHRLPEGKLVAATAKDRVADVMFLYNPGPLLAKANP